MDHLKIRCGCWNLQCTVFVLKIWLHFLAPISNGEHHFDISFLLRQVLGKNDQLLGLITDSFIWCKCSYFHLFAFSVWYGVGYQGGKWGFLAIHMFQINLNKCVKRTSSLIKLYLKAKFDYFFVEIPWFPWTSLHVRVNFHPFSIFKTLLGLVSCDSSYSNSSKFHQPISNRQV